MSTNSEGNNLLCELARTMDNRQNYTTAVALRKLAHAGYATLEEVDAASDWVLLAAPDISLRRLELVRRLVRPDWRPPSPQATAAVERFLTAGRFAVRFWPVEILHSVIHGSTRWPACDRPADKRLSMEIFSVACRRALKHCSAETLVQMTLELAGQHLPSRALTCLPPTCSDSQSKTVPLHHTDRPAPRTPVEETSAREVGGDNGHYAFPREERFEIVRRYRAARDAGKVQNKHGWAEANYQISGKTLLTYEREFAEAEP
jgi:hypothetical protein